MVPGYFAWLITRHHQTHSIVMQLHGCNRIHIRIVKLVTTDMFRFWKVARRSPYGSSTRPEQWISPDPRHRSSLPSERTFFVTRNFYTMGDIQVNTFYKGLWCAWDNARSVFFEELFECPGLVFDRNLKGKKPLAFTCTFVLFFILYNYRAWKLH